MKTKIKITGIYWHCHDNILCEYDNDYQERVEYIKAIKPKNEIETRLRLFKKVKGKLPKELIKAWEKWEKARKKWLKVKGECAEAKDKYDEA